MYTYQDKPNDLRQLLGQNGDGCFRLVAPSSDEQFLINPSPSRVGEWTSYNDTGDYNE